MSVNFRISNRLSAN